MVVQGVCRVGLKALVSFARSRVSEPQRTLEPHDIPILIELPPNRVEHADTPEAEPLVQRDRCRIRQADASDDHFHILSGQ